MSQPSDRHTIIVNTTARKTSPPGDNGSANGGTNGVDVTTATTTKIITPSKPAGSTSMGSTPSEPSISTTSSVYSPTSSRASISPLSTENPQFNPHIPPPAASGLMYYTDLNDFEVEDIIHDFNEDDPAYEEAMEDCDCDCDCEDDGAAYNGFGGCDDFMASYGVKPWELEEGRAILEAFREYDMQTAADAAAEAEEDEREGEDEGSEM